ncbi:MULTISPECIES: efflux transporter outer membrane subunit [unclassified Acinetobacter]|uniref:efflux transporter outer membrane subunit n=1 Tax=unclassified Acinetobacter TaxID=196816 RepID=UPI002934BF25|nr:MULTISPECIES: efflux transporter outer membrane subunit [unclassified Acinetobacter]WOE30442.1 efflux transporter outer membrane subunit [Acinetobacter sp. SAAs470]WOE38633.1 efflux transporter outer membrane subunit [Acinetobacter sp. SAAs474]
MQFISTRFAVTLIFATTLAGCAAVVKTPYQAPTIDIPAHFEYAQKSNDPLTPNRYADQWWTLFNDPQLNQLVNQVIAANPDLATAGINIKQAFLQAGLAQDQQGLRISASASGGHNFDLHSGDGSDKGISLNSGVSYEVDLFGKLARQTEAAKWEALATEQDLQATAQSLIATTAKLYWQLGYLNELDRVAVENLASTNKTYQLVQTQYKTGAVSGLDLAQAAQAVQSQKSTLSQIEQQKVETRTALAVLLNQTIQQLNITEPQHLPNVALPEIVAGLPASLLSRRPDLQASELRLRKTLANKDATTASYYPSISLTGSLGASSVSLTELLKNPVLSLGANLSLPFLQYNDMKKNIAISDLNYEKAIIGYRQSLYQAFADVENALSNRRALNTQVALQQRNVELAQRTEYLTQARYTHGAIALKNLLDAQETTRNARMSLVQTKQNQYNAYVTLMQALGGSPIQPHS